MLTLMKISRGTYSIVQYKVDSAATAAGKQIREIKLPGNAVLIAVYKGDKTLIPHGDTRIGRGRRRSRICGRGVPKELNVIFK